MKAYSAFAAVFQSWGPRRDVGGTEFGLKRRIKPVYFVLPEPAKTPLGQRLRYMRKQLGLTLKEFSQMARLGHNTIAKLERGEIRKVQPWVLGRILPFLASQFKKAFPEAGGDAYDFIIPPTSLGRWIKNHRLRRGMKMRELSKALIVNIYSVVRYESDRSRPSPEVRARLRRLFGDTRFL